MKRFQQILQFIKNNQLVVIFFVLILIMMLSFIFSRQDKNNSPFVDGVVKEGNYVTSDYNRFNTWEYRITSKNRTIGKDGIIYNEGLNSPTEAYEAAIEYCLTKLI